MSEIFNTCENVQEVNALFTEEQTKLFDIHEFPSATPRYE